jgi:hypothetical protein
MAKANQTKYRKEATKDMSDVEIQRWDEQHTPEYVAKIWAGGEHLRAANLAAEAQFDEKTLDDLSVLCPGIKDHMPAAPGEETQKGAVQGDPVKREMDKFQIDESEVADLSRVNEEQDVHAQAQDELAKREAKPAGKPDNTGTDGPTMHPQRHPLDHDGNGLKGGVAKPASNKGTQDTETLKK